jgi:hypothetical protein
MSDQRILDEVRDFVSLRQVIEWTCKKQPRAEFIDVIVQDEFHHDVIVRATDQLYLVFETS